jgi:hypothetical protein
MKIANLSQVTFGLTPEEEAEIKKRINGATELSSALRLVSQQKISEIDKLLDNTAELAKIDSTNYILALLEARKVYKQFVDLLSEKE